MQRQDFHAMGCHMTALVDSDSVDATEPLSTVPQWFAEWETQLSRFIPESELNRLNKANGAPMPVGEVLFEVIQASLAAAQASEGLVTPAVLKALESAGYDRTFEAIAASNVARNVASDLPVRPTQIPDWRAIQYDTQARTVQLPRGMRLDLGGIAKGWAADKAARHLAPYGPVLVDAGGDIVVSGPMANGEPWLIGVADPFDSANDLTLLLLSGGAVATSGRDYRNWTRGGKTLHHIIDPRTGLPAETDVVSATVVAPSAPLAEMAAKVVLILGSQAGLAWLQERGGFAGLVVRADQSVAQNDRMHDFLWRAVEPSLNQKEFYSVSS